MAMTTEQVLKVSTLEAVKNVTDLKNNISELKRVINGWTETTEEGGKKVVKTFQGLTIGSKEYQQAVQQLNENQAALRNAMHGTAASLDEVREAAKGASKEEIQLDAATGKLVTDNDAALQSYNGLVKTLANLKEEWRATTDETERATLGEKINAVNNKLKELDASVGVYGRNVGSYQNVVNHLGNSFTATAGGAAKMINPIKNATTGLKALSTTPVIAILGLLANVLNKIIGSLKSSEENTQKLTKAMAPFEAIGDALTKMLQAAGAALVAVVGWIGKLTEAILGNNKAAEKRLAIAKAQAELDQAQRETLIKNAEAERDIAELRAKSSDKEKYTATERLAFLEQAGRLEAEIAARAVADAKKHYQIVAARNKLSQSSKEQLQEEAQAYADMVKAETAYYNQVRTINAGITRARREETREARETAKAVKDAATAKISAEKDYLTQLLSIVKTGTESEFKIQNTIAKKEYELAVANAYASLAATLGRFAADCCLFSSQNFGFVKLPDAFTTGSSIMPQKKNPDVFELVRAHCNYLQGVPGSIRLVVGNLPSGYFRDMQLLKEMYLPLFDRMDACLDILCLALPGMSVARDLMSRPLYAQAFCVEEVNRLVADGVPFRDAYRQVGKAVQEGSFHFNGTLHHTHEGSIGNLCLPEIRERFQTLLDAF